MISEEKIRSTINLYTKYHEQARDASLSARDVEEAGRELRKMYDWRIRLETLGWVLTKDSSDV